MVGEMTNNGRIRPSFPVKDLTSNEGSEYGGPVEFTREDVEALLHERIKYKSKYNYKVSPFLSFFIALIVMFGFVSEIEISQFMQFTKRSYQMGFCCFVV